MFKLIYLLGTYFRNKEIFQSLHFLKKTETWSISELEKLQLKQAKELFRWAYKYSVLVRKKFDEQGVHPDDLISLEDIEKFPILTKEELITFNDDNHIHEGFKKLFYSQTSGSTGKRLVFNRNLEWDARHRAAMFRGYSWYGVKPWDRNGYFWGYSMSAKQRKISSVLDFFQNRFRIFSYKEDDIKAFLKKLKGAAFLEGYSSAIYEVAKYVNAKELNTDFQLKMIKGTAEKIYDHYHEDVEKAFGRRIVSEYGSAEAGIIAFECPEGNMHITMENVIVEEVDGEVLITNLVSKSFPLIRYKLGDYVVLDKMMSCKCGMKHHIIKEVTGRIGNPVYGKKEVYPSRILSYIFRNLNKNEGVSLNFQVKQDQKGKISLLIEEQITNEQRSLIVVEAKRYFQDDMDIEIKDAQIIRNTNEKFKEFISTVN